VQVESKEEGDKSLRMKNRTIVNKHSDIMVKLYKSLVRPHAAWSPHYIKDKELIEKIQHRLNKMMTEVKPPLVYIDRLLILGLWTLEERRNRSDLINSTRCYMNWNSLDNETVMASSLNCFETTLNTFYENGLLYGLVLHSPMAILNCLQSGAAAPGKYTTKIIISPRTKANKSLTVFKRQLLKVKK